jgi:DNA-binding NtrC family response regulator
MERSGTILIVDDDLLVLEALTQTFMDNYEVVAVTSGAEAIQAVESGRDLDAVILDIKMAKMDGLETARRIEKINSDLPIIFHTGYPGDYSESEIDREHRPYHYVGKNEHPQRLVRSVKNAVSYHRLKANSADLVRFARQEFGMVGKSKVMQEIYCTIEQVATSDSKVVILGPTGSGKELIARAIHKRSCRADRQLAILNCNHKSPDLVESELFGHLRGSFTGAVVDRIGLFEYADGGTVFLDEIGDLDMTTQAKILRVLETGEMQRLGSPEVMHVNVRCICATNQDLQQLVEKNKFREDLYYRLKGVTICIPPLRERREDIPELIAFYVEQHRVKEGGSVKIFEPAALDLLVEYDWPGNVRQLLDTLQALIDLSPSSFISRQEVASYLAYTGEGQRLEANDNKSFNERLREFKRILIIQTLARHNNNISAAARELSLDPSNFRKMLKDLDITLG